MLLLTHWRIVPAGSESAPESSWQQPSRPPPSSPPNARSPSTVLLSVCWSLFHTLQSVESLNTFICGAVRLIGPISDCSVLVWLRDEVICRPDWSELWIFNSDMETSSLLPPVSLCLWQFVLWTQPGLFIPLGFVSSYFFNQSWWHHLGFVALLFLKGLQTAVMLKLFYISGL